MRGVFLFISAPPLMKNQPCRKSPKTRIHNTAHNTQHERTTEHTAHNAQHSTQHTTHNTKHTTHNTQHTTHITQHTTHNTQHTTHNTIHNTTLHYTTQHNTQRTAKSPGKTEYMPPCCPCPHIFCPPLCSAHCPCSRSHSPAPSRWPSRRHAPRRAQCP